LPQFEPTGNFLMGSLPQKKVLGKNRAEHSVAVGPLQREICVRYQKGTVMGKKKIADSIIIRVGGGIREVPRESLEIAESLKSMLREPGFEQKEDTHPLGIDEEISMKFSSNKIIN